MFSEFVLGRWQLEEKVTVRHMTRSLGHIQLLAIVGPRGTEIDIIEMEIYLYPTKLCKLHPGLIPSKLQNNN